MYPPPTLSDVAASSNAALIRRLFGLAWRYRMHCFQVLGLQLLLLMMGIGGLSFTGLGIDYIRHKMDHAPMGVNALHVVLPLAWAPLQVLGLLAGLILALALGRAVLNYVLAISVNRLVQQRLVVDLRGEVYDKLQRLSFRFFDANSTGSIITRVTGDVQSVRMFVDQVLIQSVIMVVSLTAYVIYMASLSPALTVACLATTPLMAIMSMWFSRKIQPAYAHNRTLVESMVQVLAESLQGVAVTKGFGREAEARAKFSAANQACFDQQRGIFWRLSLFTPAVGFLTRINMMVLLGYGGWLVAHDQLPLGTGPPRLAVHHDRGAAFVGVQEVLQPAPRERGVVHPQQGTHGLVGVEDLAGVGAAPRDAGRGHRGLVEH
ncbi:MAG: ABC transporter ATP-binding protein, partial [Opitutaceae bacterium]